MSFKLFVIFAFIFLQLSTLTSSKNNENNVTIINSNGTVVHTDSYDHSECEGRLFDPDDIFDDNQVHSICDVLKSSPDFILRIRKYTDALVKGSVLLEADSANFFMSQCLKYDILMCANGMLIDIYTEEKIIIINPGSKSKKTVSDAYRNRVIETVRHNLVRGEWDTAIENAVVMLDYKNKNGLTVLNAPENKEARNYMYFVIAPVFAILFIAIACGLYYLELGWLNNDFFSYMDRMLENWEKIVRSEDKQIIMQEGICLFCLKNTNTYKFLYCNHSYHIRCLYKWRLLDDKCCPCSFVPIEGEESGDKNRTAPPVLKLADIKILMGNLMDAHRKESIYDYFVLNEKKIAEFNNEYDTCLEEICWVRPNKLNTYKNNRIFFKMWKTTKLMCCILAFYPSNMLNSKKGRLVRKLFAIKARGATVGGFK